LGEAGGKKVSVHGNVVCSREIEAIAFPAQAAKLNRELDLKSSRLRRPPAFAPVRSTISRVFAFGGLRVYFAHACDTGIDS
jgi:hypothetical protein